MRICKPWDGTLELKMGCLSHYPITPYPNSIWEEDIIDSR